MAKQLKKWNGRAQGVLRGHFYVAAYSQKQAAELIAIAGGSSRPSINEIREYYSASGWGTPMDGVEVTGPCVYHSKAHEKPRKIL